MAYIKIDSENRITAASYDYHCGEGEIEVEIPEEISLYDIHNYLYVDGEYVFDPLPEPEEPEEPVTNEERIAELEAALDLLLSGVTE